VQLEGLGQLKKRCDLIENRTRDLPACSVADYKDISMVTKDPLVECCCRARGNHDSFNLCVLLFYSLQDSGN
jgi:hypothetical protein